MMKRIDDEAMTVGRLKTMLGYIKGDARIIGFVVRKFPRTEEWYKIGHWDYTAEGIEIVLQPVSGKGSAGDESK